ncbi:MAG: DUF1616 domain-containing protein [Chloroflexi bacterium]|nr:DUF1616 domain-containing protein [Chloroflexota bacterium]
MSALRRYWDILAITAVQLTYITVMFWTELDVLRALLALPVLLFIPGYAALAALYPRADSLGLPERALGSVATSTALVSLLGLGLNKTSLGIDVQVYTIILLAACTVVLVIVCMLRFVFGYEPPLHPPAGFSGWGVLLLVGGGMLVIVIYSVALFPPEQAQPFTTQFYLELADGSIAADQFSRLFDSSASAVTLTLGLTNLEEHSTRYTLTRVLDTRSDVLIDDLVLEVGQNWEQQIILSPEEIASTARIAFRVYKEGSDTPYRELYLWTDLMPGRGN